MAVDDPASIVAFLGTAYKEAFSWTRCKGRLGDGCREVRIKDVRGETVRHVTERNTNRMPAKKRKKRPLTPMSVAFLFVSSPGRTRTSDQLVNSQPLYQLSYRGMGLSPKGLL
jgi:hypothetical protein